MAELLHSRSMKCGQAPNDDTQMIIKGRSDKRRYRRIVLANAMQVLLVSDPDTDKAAASMDVHVGYFCDPDELPGLAHFLEHMLFSSNKKYPEEGSFNKFLVAHGGNSNAYTSSLNTNFQLEVGADHLEKALDRFAQFFICPLFEDDATSREIRAVDSENSRNLKSDVYRLSQLESHFTCKDHPQHKFSTGNLQTLEEAPKAKGIDTRAEMLKFYQDHYSSNLMCLCVYGKESLDDLQEIVQNKFSAVENLQHEVVHFHEQPCSAEHLQIMVKAVPVMEYHTLKLSWPVTPSLLHYREVPLYYIGHLVGHEGHGSLLALLKQLGWADSSSAWEQSSLHFSFFCVELTLTDVGQEHIDEIVALIFQYIRILEKDGVASWIFDEIETAHDMCFQFQDKYSPCKYTKSIAAKMRVFPPEDWLAGALPRNFDGEVISKTIELLTPERVRMFSYSKKHKEIATEVEPWYGTQFTVEKIDDALIQLWRSADVDPRLHLPAPNEFIPTDFSILNGVDDESSSKVQQVPYVLKKTHMSRLWYKPDTEFRTPKAKVCMRFNCPESGASPEACALSMIFARMVDDYLSAPAYGARTAAFSYHFQPSIDGFDLSVAGFNSKFLELAKMIIDFVVHFEVKEDRFEAMKEMALKELTNLRFQQPLDQAQYNCEYLLVHKRLYYTEPLEAMPNLTAEDLRRIVPRLFAPVFLVCFLSGNTTSKEAEDFLQHVEKSLSNGSVVTSSAAATAPWYDVMERRITRLENGATFTYPALGRNPEEENSGLFCYLQLGEEETHLNVLVELLSVMMYEDFFHQLRTIDQLGYTVYLQGNVLFGLRGIHFCIQSTVKDPEALEVRVEAFLQQFQQTLENMSQEEFQTYVTARINRKLEKRKNIWEEIDGFWYEILEGTMNFKRKEVEAAALRTLQKQALLHFYRMYVQRDGPQRRKLSCQVYGRKHIQEFNNLKGEATASANEGATTAGNKPVETSNGTSVKEEPLENYISHTEEVAIATVKQEPLKTPISYTQEVAIDNVKEPVETSNDVTVKQETVETPISHTQGVAIATVKEPLGNHISHREDVAIATVKQETLKTPISHPKGEAITTGEESEETQKYSPTEEETSVNARESVETSALDTEGASDERESVESPNSHNEVLQQSDEAAAASTIEKSLDNGNNDHEEPKRDRSELIDDMKAFKRSHSCYTRRWGGVDLGEDAFLASDGTEEF